MNYIVSHRITKDSGQGPLVVSALDRVMDFTALCALIGETVLATTVRGDGNSLTYTDSVHCIEGRTLFHGTISWSETR